MRVYISEWEAQELVTFRGIQIILQVNISTIAAVASGIVKWRTACGAFPGRDQEATRTSADQGRY